MIEPEEDCIPEMIETSWSGEGSWTGAVEVAISPNSEGDAILTLPRLSVMGETVEGDGVDVAVPLALMRWVLAEAGRVQSSGQSEGSPS